MHGVIEVGSVLDVAAVDIERVTELFCPSRSVRLHRVHVHIDRVRQTIHHVIKVCTQHNIRSVVSLHVQFHHWRPCISGRGFARMERSAVQRHLVDITANFSDSASKQNFSCDVLTRTVSDDFPLCFMFHSEHVLRCKVSLQSLGFYDTLIIFVYNNNNNNNNNNTLCLAAAFHNP